MAMRCFYGSSAASKDRVIAQTHLTARQLRALASDLGLELIGQRHDEIVLSSGQPVHDTSLSDAYTYDIRVLARLDQLLLGDLLHGLVRTEEHVELDCARVERLPRSAASSC
jgi:hypothetical protein